MRTAEKRSRVLKQFPRIRSASFLSSWPRRMENKMEPPIPMRVAKEESRVIMGAHTPAPARESVPVVGMFPI